MAVASRSFVAASIGSGSVSVGIFRADENALSLIAAVSRTLPLEERSAEQAFSSLRQLLVETAHALASQNKAEVPSIGHLFCVVRAPWTSTHVGSATLSLKKEEKITDKTIAKLAKQALDSVSEKKNVIDTSVMKIALNGYLTERPEGKSASKVELTVLVSVCEEEVRASLANALQSAFASRPITFYSGTRALLEALGYTRPSHNDYLLLDVGQEGTAGIIVGDGAPTKESYVAEGMSSILKRASPKGNPEATLAALRLMARDECTDAACRAVQDGLAKMEPNVAQVFGRFLGTLAAPLRLPNDLLLLAPPEISSWLEQFFSRVDFNQFTQTAQPFTPVLVGIKEITDAVNLVPSGALSDTDLALTLPLINKQVQKTAVGWYNRTTMPRDYLQDITPPDESMGGGQRTQQQSMEEERPLPPPPDRGIRNVNIPPRGRGPVPPRGVGMPPPPRRRGSRKWLWVVVALAVAALAVVGLLLMFRSTSVTVIPQTQPVTFDQTSQFTAYPAATAASGTIPYTVQTTDIEGSAVVKASGTEHVDTKASGSITVVNNYSTAPVKFVKNTRFQTAGGLIFRAPADIVIPGKQGSTPGKVSITVAADQPGEQYNIGPQDKFTVPGLQSSAAEYAGVYAYSSASTTGGFSGNQPAVAPSDLSAAVAQVRSQLQTQATTFASGLSDGSQMPLSPRVTFTDAPNTPEPDGQVRIHESAHVEVPLIPAGELASFVAQAVAADITTGSVKLVPGAGFGVSIADMSGNWGSDPIDFTLSGKAQIVWVVDTNALARALAGRGSDSFQAIVSNFPGVQSAHARIEPFWDSSFPSNPSDIHITVEEPQASS